MEWNYDMSAAPRGEYRDVHRKVGDRAITVSQHFPATIFVAANDGKTVTPSKWLPEQERWNMFTKDAPPIAWMPWPTHPEATP
jgi:hypothetical protein